MPEKIRILFVGGLHSSHALSWIDLLKPFRDQFEIQGVALTAMPDTADFPVHSAAPLGYSLTDKWLRRLYRYRYRQWADVIRPIYAYEEPETQFAVLMMALGKFKPHIVHTFGFTPGALFYSGVPERILKNICWVLQTRGGSDVAYTQNDPVWQTAFRRILPQADVVLCDNLENYRIFSEMGIEVRRASRLSFVPGTGGIDLGDFTPVKPLKERKRLLLWNKAYESPWSKALPVLEGLRIVWDKIAPLCCVFTAVGTEVRDHVRLLPDALRENITICNRIPRAEMLAMMRESRVMLAPSLVDGIPNTLYEAMAAGCIPIVSPIPTLTPHFEEGVHVFYARNLYPEEIATALVKAFDDKTCGGMQERNLDKVRQMADRMDIAERVVGMYIDLAHGLKGV
jgi:glycosyltransferase involved in cell wall biosynthesis